MLDVLYILGTVAFFVLMLAYVAGCRRLGAASRAEGAKPESRS